MRGVCLLNGLSRVWPHYSVMCLWGEYSLAYMYLTYLSTLLIQLNN